MDGWIGWLCEGGFGGFLRRLGIFNIRNCSI